jgi:hypothetical protein
VGDPGILFVCAGDQAPEAVSIGKCGAADDVGGGGGISAAVEGGWNEWEYQYIFCGADQPDDPSVRVETGTAQFTLELTEHLYWWLAASRYHFPRYHKSLRIRLEKLITRKGKQRAKEYRKATPAVAAGLTDRRWSVMELISYPLP